MVKGTDIGTGLEEEGTWRNFGDEEEATGFGMSDVRASWAPTS